MLNQTVDLAHNGVTPLFENGHYNALLKLGCNSSMLWNKDLSLENSQQIIAEVKALKKNKSMKKSWKF